MDEKQFELQLFTGKEYRTIATGTRRELEPVFAIAVCPRRLVLTEKARPARPSYRKPGVPRGPSLDKRATVMAYLAWAGGKGLRHVTFYERSPHNPREWTARHPDNTVRLVPLSEFLGPAPAAELEDGP